MSFTGRTIVLLAVVALSGLAIAWQISALAIAVVLATATVDAFLVRATPEVVRTAPQLLSRGVAATLSVVPRQAGVKVRLRQPTTADIALEPAEGDGRIDAAIIAHRRGHHHLGPVAAITTGPLRMGTWYHRCGGNDHIAVYPDMPAARRLALAVRTGRFREEGRRSRGPLGLGTDFESIREYRPDDDIRQLNARATARLSVPMTNQYRIEQDRDVICVLDSGRLMRAPLRDRTRLDAAIDAVAAVAAVAEEVGDRVGVVAFDDHLLRSVRPRRDGAGYVARAVFDLEPSTADADYELAFRTVAGMKRALVIIFTDLLDEAAGSALAAAVPLLTRKHAVVLASVQDPDLTAMVAVPSLSTVDLSKTAVAADLLSRREALRADLAHRGADVIEAPLDLYSTRCVGAYLRAKQRARI